MTLAALVRPELPAGSGPSHRRPDLADLAGALADALRERSAQAMTAARLRAIAAWAIAVAGVVDPAMTSTRPMKPEVALVADRAAAGSGADRPRAPRARIADSR